MERVFQLTRTKADYLDWDTHPYDALLDLYEEGLKTEDVDRILGALRRELRWILEKVLSSGRYPQEHELERVEYNSTAMDTLCKEILWTLGYPLGERGRLDVSVHPFTRSMGIHDVRITTRYEGVDFKRALFSTLHEFGHALHHLQVDPALAYTPLEEITSLGLHEGQSRFWENMVGRSREYVEFACPPLRKHLRFLESYDPEEVYLTLTPLNPA